MQKHPRKAKAAATKTLSDAFKQYYELNSVLHIRDSDDDDSDGNFDNPRIARSKEHSPAKKRKLNANKEKNNSIKNKNNNNNNSSNSSSGSKSIIISAPIENAANIENEFSRIEKFNRNPIIDNDNDNKNNSNSGNSNNNHDDNTIFDHDEDNSAIFIESDNGEQEEHSTTIPSSAAASQFPPRQSNTLVEQVAQVASSIRTRYLQFVQEVFENAIYQVFTIDQTLVEDLNLNRVQCNQQQPIESSPEIIDLNKMDECDEDNENNDISIDDNKSSMLSFESNVDIEFLQVHNSGTLLEYNANTMDYSCETIDPIPPYTFYVHCDQSFLVRDDPIIRSVPINLHLRHKVHVVNHSCASIEVNDSHFLKLGTCSLIQKLTILHCLHSYSSTSSQLQIFKALRKLQDFSHFSNQDLEDLYTEVVDLNWSIPPHVHSSTSKLSTSAFEHLTYLFCIVCGVYKCGKHDIRFLNFNVMERFATKFEEFKKRYEAVKRVANKSLNEPCSDSCYRSPVLQDKKQDEANSLKNHNNNSSIQEDEEADEEEEARIKKMSKSQQKKPMNSNNDQYKQKQEKQLVARNRSLISPMQQQVPQWNSFQKHLLAIILPLYSGEDVFCNVAQVLQLPCVQVMNQTRKLIDKKFVIKTREFKMENDYREATIGTVDEFYPCKCNHGECNGKCHKANQKCTILCSCCRDLDKLCDLLITCSCSNGNCKSEKCPCSKGDRECMPGACTCSNCMNKNIQNGIQKKLGIGVSSKHRYGAFALSPINTGEVIQEYNGEVTSVTQTNRRSVFYSNVTYIIGLTSVADIDGYKHGNLIRFVNTSTREREINCRPKWIQCLGEYRLVLVATRKIEVGDELFMKYLPNNVNFNLN